MLDAFDCPADHFDDDGKCSDLTGHVWTWRVWAAVGTARLLASTAVTWRMYSLMERRGLPASIPAVRVARNARNIVDAAAVVWFVVGNLWLLTSATEITCGVERSLVFVACLVLLGVQYLEICLPCLLALCLVPIFCCCPAPFARLTASVQDSMDGKGADKGVIDSLPVVAHHSSTHSGAAAEADSLECPICIGAFEEGDALRVLPCEHRFHQTCVDHWLLVNATCPNCRAPITSPKNTSAPISASP